MTGGVAAAGAVGTFDAVAEPSAGVCASATLGERPRPPWAT